MVEADSDTIQETWAGGLLGEVLQTRVISWPGLAPDGPEIDRSDGPTEIDTELQYNSSQVQTYRGQSRSAPSQSPAPAEG